MRSSTIRLIVALGSSGLAACGQGQPVPTTNALDGGHAFYILSAVADRTSNGAYRYIGLSGDAASGVACSDFGGLTGVLPNAPFDPSYAAAPLLTFDLAGIDRPGTYSVAYFSQQRPGQVSIDLVSPSADGGMADTGFAVDGTFTLDELDGTYAGTFSAHFSYAVGGPTEELSGTFSAQACP